MGLKTKIGLALATTAMGATLAGAGTFALFTSTSNNNGNTFAAGTVKVDASSGKVFAGSQYLSNMAPGDTETGTLTLTNSGSLDEWVGLEHKLSGGDATHPNIFASFSSSIDKDAGGQYATDNHPLQISYSIQVKDKNGAPVGTPLTRDAFSATDTSIASPFKLGVGQHADITYTYTLPKEAHNDYQGATGKIDIEADSVQVRNNDGANGPQSWNPDIHG
jgi:spore coat-associated protein N